MQFIGVLLTFIIGVYFGADYLLASHLQNTPATAPENEKALVQNMAKFLENSPDLQKKITESGQVITAQSPPHPLSGSTEAPGVARYFGSSPTDQFFKKYIIDKKKIQPGNTDEQTKLFIELSDYIRNHPKESVEVLENALQSIPKDRIAEREAITPAFIHSVINFIEDLDDNDAAKKIYLKRFIDNAQDPEIQDAIETHFPNLVGQP